MPNFLACSFRFSEVIKNSSSQIAYHALVLSESASRGHHLF